jgi:hypothetical protein
MFWLYHLCLYHPCHCYGYFDPISVKNRIWGDKIGTYRCDADNLRLLSSVMLEAYGLRLLSGVMLEAYG